jgi:hypothetical protein
MGRQFGDSSDWPRENVFRRRRLARSESVCVWRLVAGRMGFAILNPSSIAERINEASSQLSTCLGTAGRQFQAYVSVTF